ncbi:MAG: hypothetical protein A3K04_11165 [Gallionellales bacterium RBG_16_56_9]|nr:MAG: hypothetical protein A3K04_11165 [Gallionellales bacterium RBG_16_56_9]
MSDSARCLLDANDKLHEASAMASFIQSISLNTHPNDSLLLQPGQLAGFYFVMKNMIDRIREADALIDSARKQQPDEEVCHV